MVPLCRTAGPFTCDGAILEQKHPGHASVEAAQIALARSTPPTVDCAGNLTTGTSLGGLEWNPPPGIGCFCMMGSHQRVNCAGCSFDSRMVIWRQRRRTILENNAENLEVEPDVHGRSGENLLRWGRLAAHLQNGGAGNAPADSRQPIAGPTRVSIDIHSH